MKKIAIVIILSVIYVCGAQSKEPGLLIGEERLILQSELTKGKLVLKSDEEEVVVWVSSDTSLYHKAEMLSVVGLQEEVLVLFQIDRKEAGITKLRARDLRTRHIKRPVNSHEYLLQCFIVKGDVWHSKWSAFPSSFWGDTVGEKIADIAFGENEEIVVVYDGGWEIMGSRASDMKWKIPSDKKMMVKMLRYDQEKQLIFSKDENETGEQYIDGAVWWSGDLAFDASRVMLSSINDIHEKRLIKLGIEKEHYLYIPNPSARFIKAFREQPKFLREMSLEK